MAVSISNTIVVHDDRSLANLSGLKTVNSANLIGSGDISGYHTANLGVIATSSGSSASLSGLTLTGYAFLRLIFQKVSHPDVVDRYLLVGTSTANDQQIKNATSSGEDAYGMYLVALIDGTWTAAVEGDGGAYSLYSGKGPITTSSTSVSVALDANNFNGGIVIVQGLRV